MKRINTNTAVNGHFVDGNPSVGRKATQFSAEWCNAVQDELIAAIAALTNADITGLSSSELALALGRWIGKIVVDSQDQTPGNLASKFVGNVVGGSDDVYFEAVSDQDGRRLRANIRDGAVGESKIGEGAVGESKIGDRAVSTEKLQNGSVKGQKIDLSVINWSETGIDVDTGDFEKMVRRFSSIGSGGVIDVTIDFDSVGNSSNVGITNLSVEIRAQGSSSAVAEFSVSTPGQSVSKRLVWRNGTSGLVNYELWVTGTIIDETPHGISGLTIGNIAVSGISFN